MNYIGFICSCMALSMAIYVTLHVEQSIKKIDLLIDNDIELTKENLQLIKNELDKIKKGN